MSGGVGFQLHVAREILTMLPEKKYAEEVVIKIEESIESESDVAIDASKAFVECVCKTILTERGQEYEDDWNINKLFNMTCSLLGISGSSDTEATKKLCSGALTIMQGLSELRNSYGTVSHGKDCCHLALTPWHRIMAASSAETVTKLLFDVHLGLQPNLKYTKIAYDESEPKNTLIDNYIYSYFDEESQEVVLVEAGGAMTEYGRYRPSQILYNFDRQAYLDALLQAPEIAPLEEDDV